MNYILEKNLASVADNLRIAFYSIDNCHKNGLLQKLHPFGKILFSLFILLSLNISGDVNLILTIHAFLILLVLLSGISLSDYLKRVWGITLFFTAILILPTFISFGQPETGSLKIISLPYLDNGLYLNKSAVTAGIYFLLRVAGSVASVYLLVNTTLWNRILKSFGIFRLPDELVSVLNMTYRYLFVFLISASNLFQARRSRFIGKIRKEEYYRFTGAGLMMLILKSFRFSEEIHLSLRSRGYEGRIKILKENALSPYDVLFILPAVIIFLKALTSYI